MLNKALRQKDVKINGVRIRENVTIHENDEILLYIADEFLFRKVDFNIVYEDNNVLIVNKPCGIEVISDTSKNCLTYLLKEKYAFVEPCHRLDRNTTGLVLFAKNKITLDILLKKFFKWCAFDLEKERIHYYVFELKYAAL